MNNFDSFPRTVSETEKCIKDYSSKCLDTYPRQVTNVLAFGIAKTNKGYCSGTRRKERFISIGKCGNKIKAAGDKCIHTYTDKLQGIQNMKDNKYKIPLVCWLVFHY